VPGNASGGMDGIAVKPLTVDFHESGFLGKLNGENKLAFWFELDDQGRQQVGSPWGPGNAQALNRYSYVQNNPLKYTDPSGHTWYLSHYDAAQLSKGLREVANQLSGFGPIEDIGLAVLAMVQTIAQFVKPELATALGGLFAAAITTLLALGVVAAGYVAGQINAIADLIDAANIGYPDADTVLGVALGYSNGGLYALNRTTGSLYYLDTPFFIDYSLPRTLDIGSFGGYVSRGNRKAKGYIFTPDRGTSLLLLSGNCTPSSQITNISYCS
jgi:hypothetical protein